MPRRPEHPFRPSATQAWLGGLSGVGVRGLVMINTSGANGPPLRWINDALLRCVEIGALAAVPDITRGRYLFLLKPVIAALLAVVILGQGLTIAQMLAIVVITGSVLGEIFLPGSASRQARVQPKSTA